MSDAKQADGHGVGLLGAMGLLFIGLKLGGAIDWPWLWVLVPFWGPWAIILAIALVITIFD
jgi:hypothetical protein